LLDLALVALDMEWAIPAANELFKVGGAGVLPLDLRTPPHPAPLLLQMATARLEGQSWKQVRALDNETFPHGDCCRLDTLICSYLNTRCFAPHQVLMGGLIDGINAEIPNSGKGWTKDLLSPIEQGLKAQVRQSGEREAVPPC